MEPTSIDRTLLMELDSLGLSPDAYRAILLLPLVEVAWVDGEVQQAEREEILAYADGNQLLAGEALGVVEDWLSERPAADYFARGRAILVKMANKSENFAADVRPADVDDILAYCEVVADAAGGLFNTFFRSSDAEREAIRQIAVHVARLNAHYQQDP